MTIEEYKTQEGYECPTCERVLNTSLGLKQHHTKVHGESLVKTAECNWCGDEFHVRPSQVGNFCSRECQMEHRSEHGEPGRRRQVTLMCEGCGEEFSVPKSAAEAGKKYCSNDCYYSDSAAEWLECEWCDDDFYVHGSYTKEARFCSQDCYGEWLSARRSGINSPLWKGDDRETPRKKYGPGWGEKKRSIVREQANYECEDCGRSQSDHRKEYDRRLAVHHLVDPDRSINPAVHNAPRNLVALCVSCHHDRHPKR